MTSIYCDCVPCAGYHWDPEILLTELVPFINLTNPTLHDPGRICCTENTSCGKFGHFMFGVCVWLCVCVWGGGGMCMCVCVVVCV